MSLEHCVSLLSLRDKLPVDEIRDVADQYHKEGTPRAEAMQRAVQEHLDMAKQEQSKLIEHVRGKWQEAGGKLPEPAAGERKDDPYTRDLFGGQDLFDNVESRPGTVDAQKDAGRAAISDLAKRLGIDRINRRDPAQGAKVSVLGSRLMADFVAGKPAQLVGQQVESPHDLAVLAQVYRDPRFETFRVFYMKDGKIEGEAGYTSRLPSAVHLPEDLYAQVRADKARFGADGYYLLHNHPSGRAEPSSADQRMTNALDAEVGGFLGHVVVDHNEYAVIQNWGSEVHKAPQLNGRDFSSIPEVEHGLLGTKLSSPEAVARAAKAIQIKDGFATLVMTNAKSEVSLIVDVPIKALDMAKGREGRSQAKALIRRMARETGAGSHRFLILPSDGMSTSPYLHLIADGIVTDIARPNGSTATQEGAYSRGDFMDRMPRRTNRLSDDAEKYGTDEATGLPLNSDGTVTVYHHTSRENADRIRQTGMLKSAGEPDVYVTTHPDTDTGYGDTAVPVKVDPAKLQIDDEFPNGRRDFRIDTGKPGGSVRVQIDDAAGRVSDENDKYGNERTIEVDGQRRPIYDTSGRLIAGGDFAKQKEFWRNFDGKTDENGRPILAEDDPRAVREEAAPYGQEGEPDPKPEGPAAKELYVARSTGKTFLESASKAWREVTMFADPMGRGSMAAQRATSDYERALVKSNHQWNGLFRELTKRYTPDQLRDMWDAGDEQNVLMQQGLPTEGKGIDRLPPDQRSVSKLIHQYGNELLADAGKEGMFEGEGLPYWTTRMVVQIGEDGDVSKLTGGSGGKRGASGSATEALGFTKDASSLKHRKHLTTDETEAAAGFHAEDGKKAVVVRDIRTNILAMARLEKAIAGRRLLNQIKAHGLLTGEELVGGSGDDFVEINHPAFVQWKPEMVKNADGKWEPRVDQHGEMNFLPTYLKIRKDWEGPLRAVLSSELDFKNLYKAYSRLKAESMNFNMASPLIHNMVILGRAAAYGKPVLTALNAYAVGRKLRTDYAAQSEMIERGMNPIGNHGFIQDITGLAAGESIDPGRSLTAKAISGLVGAINKSAGQATARGIDKIGDFWHGTLLWDLIGDLQRGLYVHMKSAKMREGLDEVSAGEFAGHFSNRFAGSIRNSAMSAGARQLLNVMLFSRSFTAGNLGIVKDMFQGIPSDSYAQAYTRAGAERAALLVSAGRKEAISAFIKDYGLALVSTNLIAASLIAWQQDDFKRGLGDVMGQYRDNYLDMLKMGGEHWSNWINPWFVPDHLSLLSANEKDRTDRVHTGDEADGTAIYTRIPSGKVPEEIRNWMTKPVKTLTSKLAPLPKSAWEAATNKVGSFDQPLYPEDAEWYKKVMPMLGHVMASQLPLDTMKAHFDILAGKETPATNDGILKTPERQKAAGFWTGFTTSHGYPGGPEAGLRAEVERGYREKVGLAMPAIRNALKHEDYDKADQLMDDAGIPVKERASIMHRVEAPGTGRGTAQANRKFNAHSTDDERDRLDRMRSHAGH